MGNIPPPPPGYLTDQKALILLGLKKFCINVQLFTFSCERKKRTYFSENLGIGESIFIENRTKIIAVRTGKA